MSNKNKYMFILGISLILLFAVSIGNFDLSKVATDSGFDTSYGGGGSSSSSSSSSSWGSSSSSGSNGDITVFFDKATNIAFGFFIVLFFAFLFVRIVGTKPKIIIAIIIVMTILLAIARLLLLSFVVGMVGFFVIGVPILMSRQTNSSVEKKLKKRQYLPKNEENLKILKEGYEIFTNVQYAWMNFDYDMLREETTDELYNMYHNQLQTLQLKGQINQMHNFELINYELLKIEEKNDLVTTVMELEVKFYDYIVDNSGKVLKGSISRKVHMLYDLTFVYNKKAITECPNCEAPLNNKESVCSHCNTVIPSIRSKMKLSTKKCLMQK